MAIPPIVWFLLGFIQPILMFIGGLSIMFWIFLKVAPKLPATVTDMVQKRLLRKAVGMGGPMQALVQDSDGVLQLTKAQYDGGNNGYWVRHGGELQFYSAEGKGGSPKWFYGKNVILAYDGLGAVSDLVSAEIGRQAKVKKQTGKGAISSAKDKLLGSQAMTDGGEEVEESKFTAYVPKRALVDLRDTLCNAPFHVRPAQFHRVEENAKAGQSVGVGENVIRFGLLMTGFMLAIIANVVLGGGGGGGGGATLPMMLAGVPM